MMEEERDEGRRRRAAVMLLLLFLLVAAACSWFLFANVSLGEAESFIPAPLSSEALANYGEDKLPSRLRSLSISIVEAVIRDRAPEEEDVGARATKVSESLKSPVPTVTPKPGDPTGTPTGPPTRAPTTTSTPDLLVTGTATATVSPSPSPFPSRTPMATKTDIPTAGPSSTPGLSSTPTPCKVIPKLYLKFPTDGTIYNPGAELEGHAHAWDPDNVNPSNCEASPEVNGEGILEVEFRVKKSGATVYSWIDLSSEYCAFGGGSPCNTIPVNGGVWPDFTPIEAGNDYELWARALDDDSPGQYSAWDFASFEIILPAPTLTPLPPTPTLSPPTPTPLPPTPTLSPPTFTPLPPTPAATPACSGITIAGFSRNGKDVRWDVTNGYGSQITLTQIDLAWSFPDALAMVKLNSADIWNLGAPPPSVTINSNWVGPTRDFIAGQTREIRFRFQNTPSLSGYSLTLTFDVGCTPTFNN